MRDETHHTTFIERLVGSPGIRSGYASLIVHVAVLIVLALAMIPTGIRVRPRPIVIVPADAAEHDTDSGSSAGDGLPEPAMVDIAAHAPAAADPIVPESAPEIIEPVPPLPPAPVAATPASVRIADQEVTIVVAARPVGASPDGADPIRRAFAGRSGPERGRGVLDHGGSAASEAAVERGLAWLARHQAADGSWRFDLSGCQCDGACRDPGTVSSTTAATGIALLPFLGAGHTHVEGAHRETVTRAIYYLMSRMQPTPRGGDLSEGTMYGHGVATLALAEALGMTRDQALVRYVRDAVRFIETAQDLHGGGWRYLPGQPGDTTVTGWQLAAVKSAGLAGIPVPSPTIDGVCRFLDRVQVRRGEAYGYQSPHSRPATSAIGLLCRLYTGWPDNAAIDRGLATLAKPGPAPDAVYLNFYLSQALLQRDHPAWPKWNSRNRDQLIARQAAIGHEAGSWFFADPETAAGGRVAHTALGVLTLEVYYRLLPIYRPEAVATGW
ncbi:MAG: prenyltransferase/squalene oxidase repeat-containing protein [Pirellulales bacterium]